MGITSAPDIRAQLGADRVLDPPGALPQPAERLNPCGPVRDYEFEVAVERLYLDSTSLRNIRERCDGDRVLMAARIAEIVAVRGKMHNPETDSGGVLLGAATAAGERCESPPEPGQPIVTLGSLTLTPLRLERVGVADPHSPQIDVEGTAYVFDRASWAPLPADIPAATAIEIFDVCSAATQTRELVEGAGSVLVLGAGHGGKLALAAARDTAPAATLTAVDVEPAAVERVVGLGLADHGIATDLRDPVSALEALRAEGIGPADLTVVVVNATHCEPAAILLTAERGAILFFSMATHFSSAALAADGIGSGVRMLLGSGYTADRGAYALDLVRNSPALREAFGLDPEVAA